MPYWALFLPTRLLASGNRCLVKNANWILLHFVRRTASSARVARTKKDRHPIGCLSFFGGATQIRTGGRGVADLCLTTWPWRHIYLTDELYHKTSELSRGFVSIFVKVWLLLILERLRLARSVCHFGGKQTNFLDVLQHHFASQRRKVRPLLVWMKFAGLESQCCYGNIVPSLFDGLYHHFTS